jgi:hypothetical protein
VSWKLLEIACDWAKDHWKSALGASMFSIASSLFSIQWHLYWPYAVMIGGFIFAAWLTASEHKYRRKSATLATAQAEVSNSRSSLSFAPAATVNPITPDTGVLIRRIDFSYLPDGSTLDHGWELAKEENPGTLPKITPLRDVTVCAEVMMSIEKKGWYGLDYLLPHVSVYDRVRFTARFGDSGVLYFKFRVWASEGQEKTVWIAQMPVGGTSPHGDGSIEWRVSMPKKILPDGWIMFDLPLRDQVNATFRRSEYQLLGIRVRGSLDVSPIEFFGPSRQEKDEA